MPGGDDLATEIGWATLGVVPLVAAIWVWRRGLWELLVAIHAVVVLVILGVIRIRTTLFM